MDEQTTRQVQGAAELVRDGVRSAAAAIETAHLEIAEIPYRLLRRVPLASGPVGAIERTQSTITRLAYGSVRAIAGAAAAGVTLALKLHHPPRAG